MAAISQPSLNIPISFTNHFDTGCRYLREGNEIKAEEFFEKASRACPEAWLGIACQSQAAGDKQEALRRMAQVFSATEKPMLKSIAANNIGTILSDDGHSMEAKKYFELSFSLWKNADSLANLALVAKHNGHIDLAMRLIRKSVDMNPRQHQSWFTLALLELVIGDYSNGFRHYEERWKNPKTDLQKLPIFRKEWNGENLRGKTILVYSEQGAGDTIQMLRYLPLLKANGAKVLIAPQKGLGKLCQRMGFDDVFEDILERIKHGNIPPFDYLIPTMSLPRAFRTSLANIPPPPSIRVHPVEFRRDRLNVGIVWAGSSSHAHDKWRSTSLAQWSRLWEIPVHWHSLQVGPRAVDILAHDAPIIDNTSHLATYADTADYVAGLDLVIGVDTSVIHLAGSIGKQTWILNGFSPDWRWLLHRSDSPWYPSVRQFRQVQPMDWRWVFDDVKRELEKLCSSFQNRN